MLHLTKTCTIIIIILLVTIRSNMAVNILILSPLGIASYFYGLNALVTRLAEKGHTITVLSTFNFPQHENITQIVTENAVLLNFSHVDLTTDVSTTISKLLFTINMGLLSAENMYSNADFQKLILSDVKFDAVISMDLPYVFGISAVEDIYKCVGITLLSHGPLIQMLWLLGEPFNPAYQPDLKTSLDDNMSFYERLYNMYASLLSLFITYFYALPRNEYILDKAAETIPALKDRPPLTDIIPNKSLILVPTDHTTDYNYFHSPRIKHIAGLAVGNNHSVSKVFEDFINNASEGVMVISWGSLVRGKNIDICENIILSTLSKLKQNIIWKYNNTNGIELPKHVLASHWIPQQQILANKNVKVFMTHGGISSISEATHYGVPVIVTPFYMDQYKNARRMELAGVGIALQQDNFTEESIIWAVNEIMTNPKYKQEAIRRSEMFKDRILSPRDEAVYWIEYVIKHGNIFNTAASKMSIFKLYSLDIIALLLFIITFIVVFVKIIKKQNSIKFKTS